MRLYRRELTASDTLMAGVRMSLEDVFLQVTTEEVPEEAVRA